MKSENFFRIITIFGLIAIVVFIANAASAVQLNRIDWDAKSDWSAVGHCGIHDRCFLISNLTSGVESHRSFTRPQLSSKVIHFEQKSKRPIKSESKVKVKGREFDLTDNKLEEKFWAASLDEKKKYPLTLRRKFIRTRRERQMKNEIDKYRKEMGRRMTKKFKRENPNPPPPPANPIYKPYTKEEIEILGTVDRRPTVGEKFGLARGGKVSNQSKVGNTVINLEVK